MRQKHVFETREVAHIWASQSQNNGRNAQGNFYFDGPSIYSYGGHFEIARILADKKTVLFTTRTYSVTTSKHISMARYAVSHMNLFYVDSFCDHNANIQYYDKHIRKDIEVLQKSRTRIDYKVKDITRKITQMALYRDRFKTELSKDSLRLVRYWKKREFIKPSVLAKLKKTESKILASARVREHKHQVELGRLRIQRDMMVKAYENWKEEIDRLTAQAWKNGAVDSYHMRFYEMPVSLRIKDNQIETSQGAFVPIVDAKRLYQMIRAKESIQGFMIGSYEVSGIHDGKLIIGCHQIPIREVVAMARQLGLEKEVII